MKTSKIEWVAIVVMLVVAGFAAVGFNNALHTDSAAFIANSYK